MSEDAKQPNFRFGLEDEEIICRKLETIASGIRDGSVVLRAFGQSNVQNCEDFEEFKLKIEFAQHVVA